MDSPQRNYKRKELLSNPKSQIKIILAFILPFFIYMALVTFIAMKSTLNLSDKVLELAQLKTQTDAELVEIVHKVETSLDHKLIILNFIFGSFIIIISTLLSHKILGPITRLNSYLKNFVLGEGESYNLTIRKYDFFKELIENFNNFQKKLGIIKEEDEKK